MISILYLYLFQDVLFSVIFYYLGFGAMCVSFDYGVKRRHFYRALGWTLVSIVCFLLLSLVGIHLMLVVRKLVM